MTQEEIAEVRAKRAELDKRREELQKEKIRLNAEYTHIEGRCTHPGLVLSSNHISRLNGECEICGRCW